MKQNKIKILILAVISAVCMVLLASCDKNTYVGNAVYEIDDLAGLCAINDKLGPDYADATFDLNADITIDAADWKPIGESVERSFRGKFNGNGHTITFVNSLADSVFEPFDGDSYGLFGYVAGSEFENLNLVLDYKILSRPDISFVGGLAGFSYGKNTFKNITVAGSLKAVPAFVSELSALDDTYKEINKKSSIWAGLPGIRPAN
jgi:hypothetical protein